MQSKSCVYWIRAPHHKDIVTEGYVGVSVTGASARFRGHRAAAKMGSTLPVHNAIRKYGDAIVLETILNGSPDYCYLMEGKLRPTPRIGYNISVGGTSTNLGSKHTPETRAKMSIKSKGRPCSNYTRQLRSIIGKGRLHTDATKAVMSEKAKVRGMSADVITKGAEHNRNLQPWQNPAASQELWMSAPEIYQYMLDNPTHGTRNMAPAVGFSYGQLRVIHKKIKAGWNPLLDTEWLIFSGKLTPDASGDKSI